jgi:hypothetical protein
MQRKARFAAIAVAAVATLGLAPAAHAQGGDVIKTGACSGGSDWKLKVGLDNGAIDGEFEVDSNVVGQTWKVTIFDNDVRVVKQSFVTQAPSGSFTANINTANQAGTDRIQAKASNPDTGETCKAQLAFNG